MIFSAQAWKISVLTIVALPLLIRLGYWQLERAEEKRDLQSQYEQNQAQQTMTSDELFYARENHSLSDLANRRVRFEGRYLSGYNVLLDNQIQDGEVGYHVLSPFLLDRDRAVWINRGWIKGRPDRVLPRVPHHASTAIIEASVYQALGEVFQLKDDVWLAGWPLLVQSIDESRLNQRIANELASVFFPLTLRIAPGYSGALTVNWQVINTKPEKHTAYAIQWFGMALALTMLWLYTVYQLYRTEN